MDSSGEDNPPATSSTTNVDNGDDGGLDRTMSRQAMEELYELRERNQLCDATILLEDGTSFPVHRAILCACSTYFK